RRSRWPRRRAPRPARRRRRRTASSAAAGAVPARPPAKLGSGWESDLRPSCLVKGIDLGDPKVEAVEQVDHLVPEELALLDQHVGDALDGLAVALDQPVGGTEGLPEQLR